MFSWSIRAKCNILFFNAVDYFNFFLPNDYKPELYVRVTVGVAACAGAVLTLILLRRGKNLQLYC